MTTNDTENDQHYHWWALSYDQDGQKVARRNDQTYTFNRAAARGAERFHKRTGELPHGYFVRQCYENCVEG